MTRQIKTGEGWRVGWNPAAAEFKGLVAGAQWAIELTETELTDLIRLANQLAIAIAQIATELMEEEHITCEAESASLWLEVDGRPEAYSLRFIVLTGRGAEGTWPATVVPEIQQALQTLQVF